MRDLETRMRKALLQLVVVSTAPAQNPEGRTSHGKPGSFAPPRCEAPGVVLAAKWAEASFDDRQAVVEEAERVVREWRFSRRPAVDCTTLDGRLQVGREPGDVADVAYKYGYSVSHVYRLRREALKHDRQEAA